MPRKRRAPQPVRRIDPAALAEFQAGIRKRYSNEEILEQLRASAERLGRSPTMREFEADPETTVHPQTVIQHFKTWNEAKRQAGLVPRRFAQPADLIRQLRELGDELGRPPTAKDLDAHRDSMPSKSLYWHMFGSLKNALREAGFDVPVGEERLERAIDQGAALSRKLGRLPKFADWKEARGKDAELLSEWQIYRMLEPLLPHRDVEPRLAQRVLERAEHVPVQRLRGHGVAVLVEVLRGRWASQRLAELLQLPNQV